MIEKLIIVYSSILCKSNNAMTTNDDRNHPWHRIWFIAENRISSRKPLDLEKSYFIQQAVESDKAVCYET